MTALWPVRPPCWPRVKHPAPTWWTVVKDGNLRAEVLVVDNGGVRALPVFSGEGEAEMYVWLGGAFENGWRVRETTAGELVSILCGPCAGVGSVALDPSPDIEAETLRLISVGRTRFVSWISESSCSFSPATGARDNARNLVGRH